MSFTLEFEPLGIRLVCDQPLTLLEAAHQTGIQLRSECGGKGTCGKCHIQLLEGTFDSPTPIEQKHLTPAQLSSRLRLACRTIARSDAKLNIPPESLIQEQVLQTEGAAHEFAPDPAVHQVLVKLSPPSLADLQADWQRVQSDLQTHNLGNLKASLPVICSIRNELRRSQWKINLIHNDKEILHALPQTNFIPVGLAVDVGSTKLACYLVDLSSGKTIAALGVINPQISFGEDIMSRLGAVLEDEKNAHELQNAVISGINCACQDMCTSVNITPNSIVDVCLVGNTAMHHLFLGLPVQPLAQSPFVPALTSALYPRAQAIGIQAMPGARVYAPPVIAGFVGSDHLAFLLASGFGTDSRTRLGIDIGTNTEIALQSNNRIVSVSTASGPAFEGAHIRFGMRAAPGAIEHITIAEDGRAVCQVIGNQPAVGICGSGILDAVAEFRLTGLINERGRLDKNSPVIFKDSDGQLSYQLIQANENQREINIDQKDIDQILLAKGAIRAGIDILLDDLKIKAEEIDEVVIAGAFGSYMNPDHAMRIGLLPPIKKDCVHAVGNAAGMGARMMLASMEMRARALELAHKIEYLELTVYPDFPLFFAKGIRA